MAISRGTLSLYSDEEFQAAGKSIIDNEFPTNKNLAIDEAALTGRDPHSPRETQLSAITRLARLAVISPISRCGWSEQVPIQPPIASGGDR
jgi:hypothetical protein